MARAYDEIVNFIAAGTTPDSVARFEPSQETKDYVADLILKEKTAGLTPEQSSELDHFMKLEHLMRLAKARAQARLLEMTSYVSADLRRLAQSRASNVCEYCLVHEDDTYLGCQVDHVIAEKHGGPTRADNLGYASLCNRAKGTDIGSVEPSTGEFTRFFNPRVDRWADHFALKGVVIEPRTPIGEATARVLGFNQPERILEREAIKRIGRYPPQAATKRITDET